MNRFFTFLSPFIPVIALANGGWNGHMGAGWFPMFGGMWCWFFVIILFFLILGLAIFLVLRLTGGKHKPDGALPADDLLTVLKTRYAKGEIPKDQYEEMKKDILND